MIASELIRDALLDCGGLGQHETAAGQSLTDALRKLTLLVKSWQSKGYQLWKRAEVTVFLNPGQASYLLGPSGDHWAAEYEVTTLNGDHLAGVTTLTLNDAIGHPGDQIGIELADGTRQWTTIQTAAPTLKLDDALTGAASDRATVYAYTDRPPRPLKVIRARRGAYNGDEIPIDIRALDEYADQVNKLTPGTPIFVAYQPTLVDGTLYVWQPSTVRNVLRLSVGLPFDDIAATDELDFPDEWLLAVSKNLANQLEPSFRILNGQRRIELKQDAMRLLNEALMGDNDGGSIMFQPG